jgi:dipeptidyl aminopeptidase/acylaminoacyl peptidase
MKKLLLIIPIAALLAAGCNSSHQTSAQVPAQTPVVQNSAPTPTITPTPSSGPTMTFTLTPSADGSGQQDLNLFANDKKVATIPNQEPGDYHFTDGVIKFYGENAKKVLFDVTPEIGIGDFSCEDIVYSLNLQTNVVATLAQPNACVVDWTPDLQYIAFTSGGKNGTMNTLNVINTDTKSDETISIPTVPAVLKGYSAEIIGIKFSPDQSKVAVVQGYYTGASGPSIIAATIYIANLESKAVTVYQQDTSHALQVTGWKNNTTPDWSTSTGY